MSPVKVMRSCRLRPAFHRRAVNGATGSVNRPFSILFGTTGDLYIILILLNPRRPPGFVISPRTYYIGSPPLSHGISSIPLVFGTGVLGKPSTWTSAARKQVSGANHYITHVGSALGRIERMQHF